MPPVFRFLPALLLTLAAAAAQNTRPHCELKVEKTTVKIFLEADEIVGAGFSPGAAKEYLKLLGLPADIGVRSEVWICDRAATANDVFEIPARCFAYFLINQFVYFLIMLMHI